MSAPIRIATRATFSRSFLPLRRDDPQDAVCASHRLLIKAGFVRQTSAGIYNILPMGLRVLSKIIGLIDSELGAIGCQKLSMPLLQSSDLWKQTGRWQSTGAELMRLKDRKGVEFCLSPTHEECITQLVASEVHSYKDLPQRLYQIDRKYRDEARPRFGLIRGREFLMKDLYTFDTNQKDAFETYDQVSDAYCRIFDRLGMRYARVEADTGNIGGTRSHEFQILTDIGEDSVLSCSSCGYAANVEKVNCVLPSSCATPPTLSKAQITSLLSQNLADASLFSIKQQPSAYVLCLTPKDRTINEIKLKAHVASGELEPVPLESISNKSSSSISLRIAVHGSLLDSTASLSSPSSAPLASPFDALIQSSTVCDNGITIADLMNAKEGDTCPCPSCSGNGKLEHARGIEVGHIFYLGTKYSEPLGAKFVDSNSVSKPIEMGCFGIGVSRIMSAVVEASHDAEGIIWPTSIAPYLASIVDLLPQKQNGAERAAELYDEIAPILSGHTSSPLLSALSISSPQDSQVIIDDRREGPGVKLKDSAMLGFPFSIVIGTRGIKEGKYELQVRATGEKKMMTLGDLTSYFGEWRSKNQ